MSDADTVLREMQADALGAGLYGTDTISVTPDGGSASVLTGHVRRVLMMEEPGEEGLAEIARIRATVATADLPTGAATETELAEATITYDGQSYRVTGATLRRAHAIIEAQRTVRSRRTQHGFRR